MLADIFQKTVVLPDQSMDASLLGATRYAGRALGLVLETEEGKASKVEPDALNAGIYGEAYQKFRTLAGNIQA